MSYTSISLIKFGERIIILMKIPEIKGYIFLLIPLTVFLDFLENLSQEILMAY